MFEPPLPSVAVAVVFPDPPPQLASETHRSTHGRVAKRTVVVQVRQITDFIPSGAVQRYMSGFAYAA